MLRARWAAIGAAVAVTLGAGGFGLARAAVDSGDKPVTVTVAPERVLDTRNDVGLSGRFVSDTPRELKVTGEVEVGSGGTKTVVPDDAVGVVVNITVVSPDDGGFLSLRPGGSTGVPTTSTVNFSSGTTVPNAATVDLGDDGTVEIYLKMNRAGRSAHVLLDIVGFTVDHNHDDRYYTEGEIDDALFDVRLDTLTSFYMKGAVDSAIAAAAGVDYSTVNDNVPLDIPAYTDLQSLEVEVPADGHLIVTATAQVVGKSGIGVVCTVGTASATAGPLITGVQFLGGTYITNFALTGGIPVTAGTTTLYHSCTQSNGVAGDVTVQQSALSVVFSANRL